MNKKPASIDGFVPRNRANNNSTSRPNLSEINHQVKAKSKTTPKTTPISVEETTVIDIDLEDNKSLRKADKRQKSKQLKKEKKKKSVLRRVLKTILLLLVLAIIGLVVYFGVKVVNTSDSVFEGGIFGFIKKERLKSDASGRTNLLIFGTAEDDEGGTHDGGNLTDSIMVISANQDSKTASMISIPRDLWVQYQEMCTVGVYGKINAQYFCASNDGENEAAGAEALMQKIGEVTGLEMHYYVHLNFTAVIDVVDAVGGVEIEIESEDPRGIYDPNFDWKCNYQCKMVYYPNGPTGIMDGEHALALARARNAQGGYGLPNSNFDREKNQQKILAALLDKAMSTDTLTDIGKVTKILDAVGANLRTNINTNEVRTFMDVASNIGKDGMLSISLVDPEQPMLTTGNISGQSVVLPAAGNLNFTYIHQFIFNNLATDPAAKEAAEIFVLNGSDVTGLAARLKDQLESAGLNIKGVDNTEYSSTSKIEIYQLDEPKTATKKRLEDDYGISVKPGSNLPAELSGIEADFIIIIFDESVILDA